MNESVISMKNDTSNKQKKINFLNPFFDSFLSSRIIKCEQEMETQQNEIRIKYHQGGKTFVVRKISIEKFNNLNQHFFGVVFECLVWFYSK